MKRIGLIVLAAFIGGAAAIGGYKLLEPKNDGLCHLLISKNVFFANNPKNIISRSSRFCGGSSGGFACCGTH